MLKRKTPLKTTKQWRPRKSKAARNREFSPAVRKAIIERDNGECVRCGSQYNHIHHVIYRSAMGTGEIDNGCLVCFRCHHEAHHDASVRKWFEDYKARFLEGSE